MKIARIVPVIAMIGFAGAANAAIWEANNLLLPTRSATGCPDHHDRYRFELVGTTFTAHNVNGPLFVTNVASDGAVDLNFKSPGGADLQISGNAKTRDLEIFDAKFACRYKLVPKGRQ